MSAFAFLRLFCIFGQITNAAITSPIASTIKRPAAIVPMSCVVVGHGSLILADVGIIVVGGGVGVVTCSVVGISVVVQGSVGGGPVGGMYSRNVACTILETSDIRPTSSTAFKAKAKLTVVSFSPIGTLTINNSVLPDSFGLVKLPKMTSDWSIEMAPSKLFIISDVVLDRRMS